MVDIVVVDDDDAMDDNEDGDCIALVQHSVSIVKTKEKWSHRAYGKVICKVLEWDIDRLPSSIVGEHKASELQGNDVNAIKDVDIAGCNETLNKNLDNEDLNGKANDAMVEGDSMVCEEVSVVAHVEEKNKGNQLLDEAEGNTGGAVNNLEPVFNNGFGSSTVKKVDDAEELMQFQTNDENQVS